MSNPNEGIFMLWRYLPSGEAIRVGALLVKQSAEKKITSIEFGYLTTYLTHPQRIPLDPIFAPLEAGIKSYDTAGRELPGFIDDCLPDRWGERVIAMHLDVRHLDIVTLLGNLKGQPMGDIVIKNLSSTSPLQARRPLSFNEVKSINSSLWDSDFTNPDVKPEELDMLVLMGSGSGGARPKILVEHNNKQWLAKFDVTGDPFSVCGAEWASMKLAKAAGLNVPEVQLSMVGDRRCLLVERFDVSSDGGRYHLLTLNALLKSEHTQESPTNASYEDIARLIKFHSINPEEDLKQLLGQILLNGALKNTDDHLRNFSFINRGIGFQLSPAYDIVPQAGTGLTSQLSFMQSVYLPNISEAPKAAKALGLPESVGAEIGGRITKAFKSWSELIEQAGVADVELLVRIGGRFS